MKSNSEKRACERHGYAADIVFSFFNKKPSYNAEILNLGLGGMCFRSNVWLQPGATIWICIKKMNSSPCSEGLRAATLAEVKWCSELSGATVLSYGVGAKYFIPFY